MLTGDALVLRDGAPRLLSMRANGRSCIFGEAPRSTPAGATALLTLGAALAVTSAQAQTEVPSTPPRDAMRFEVVDTAGLCADCTVIQGTGRILDGRVDGFWSLVRRRRPKGTVTVALHSWGGSMENAMLLGAAIRSINARTIVGRAVRRADAVEIAPGTCNSACTLAFAGGSRRAVPQGSAYGVHRWLPMALIEPAPEDARKPRTLDRETVQRLHADTARYMAYLDRMGVDVRVMMRALQTPYERMNRLSPQDLREFRVVTEDRLVERWPDRSRPVLVLEPGGAPPPGRPGRGGLGSLLHPASRSGRTGP